jgi:hypothetical protein
MFHCYVDDHMKGGMQTLYRLLDKDETVGSATGTRVSAVAHNQLIESYWPYSLTRLAGSLWLRPAMAVFNFRLALHVPDSVQIPSCDSAECSSPHARNAQI